MTVTEAVALMGNIIQILVGGITGVATGIGSGLSALVSAIFLTEGALSVFGIVVIIFAGLSLAIGLSRWVLGFISTLGARNT